MHWKNEEGRNEEEKVKGARNFCEAVNGTSQVSRWELIGFKFCLVSISPHILRLWLGVFGVCFQCDQRIPCPGDRVKLFFVFLISFQIVPGSSCHLSAPSLAIQQSTGCAEQELVAFLECESHLDRFHPRPLALISNQSQWDAFCETANVQFRPCVQVGFCSFQLIFVIIY